MRLRSDQPKTRRGLAGASREPAARLSRRPLELALCVALALVACSDAGNDGADSDATGDTAPGFILDVSAAVPAARPVHFAVDGGPTADADAGDTADASDAPDDPPHDGADGDAPDPSDAVDQTDATDALDAPDASLCGSRDPPATGAPYVRAGTGQTTFEDVENCTLVPLVVGLQGSGHVWGSIAVGGFVAEEDALFNLDFTFEQEGEIVAEAHFLDALRRGGEPAEGPYHYAGVTVVVHLSLTLESRLGIPGILRVRVSDGDGLDLTDEVVLIPNELVE